jgi:nucleotide-binding universal stress UspA family protein
MFEVLIVAVDGSEQSLLALAYAKNLAECYHSKMIVVHAYPGTHDLREVPEYERLISRRKSSGQKVLDHARRQLGEVSFEVEEDLLEGPAANAILTVAEIRNANLIILGTRGMGNVKGVIFGSVSNKVMHYAPCAVMVVR